MKQGVLVNHRVRLLFKKAWCTIVRFQKWFQVTSPSRIGQLLKSSFSPCFAVPEGHELLPWAPKGLPQAQVCSRQHSVGRWLHPDVGHLLSQTSLKSIFDPRQFFWPLRFKVWLAFGKLFQCRLHRRPWPCCDPLGCLADNLPVKRASAPPVIADCLRLLIFGESLICIAALLSMIGFTVMYCGILLGSSSHPNLSSTLLIGDGQEGWSGHPRPHSFLADSLASLLKSSWHAPFLESFIVTEPLGPYASRWIQVWLRMTPSPDAWDQRGPGSLDDRIK